VVEDPVHEMTLAEARRIQPDAEVGSEIRIPKNTDQLGRISAQTAKQVILQKVRERNARRCTTSTRGARANW